MKAPSVKPVRCAIYTRVSTDHGLDQEFNSLDAQHDAASAYIKSQAHAGWTLIRSRYDDGGYSGGSTDRPDLQRLLDDIGGEGRELPIDRTVRGQIVAVAHLEARDHRELLVCAAAFGHATHSRLEELLIGRRYLMAPMVKPATKRATKKL